MKLARRWFLAAALAAAALGSACVATAPQAGSASGAAVPAEARVRSALAPAGSLRVAVYLGSPTSLVRDPRTGAAAGVAVDLGAALARDLGVPVQLVEFSRVAQVIDALKTGQADFTFTNMTEDRVRDLEFAQPLVQLELGYLVPQASRLRHGDEIDRVGLRVGVSEGSTSQGVLKRRFKNATVVGAASLSQAQDMLRQGRLDAFATNKGVLFEMSDTLEGSRVLDGRWGAETMGIAVPRGRDAGVGYLREFALRVRGDGTLDAAIRRAGLRGTLRVD